MIHRAALAETGLVPPERLAGMTATVVENTDDNVYLVCRGRAIARRVAW